MKIGIFDSGIGGEAVAKDLRVTFPAADIITISDKKHMPYGNRSQDDIIALTNTAIRPLLDARCDVIVIACNTATAAAIETLRRNHSSQLFIGLEPMLKPASALTTTGVVAVCATPATLASSRYVAAKQQYSDVTFFEPDCHEWAHLIEHNAMHEAHITQVVETSIKAHADVIVLGCTHYHWIKEQIAQLAHGYATILEPSEAIGKRVASLLNIK